MHNRLLTLSALDRRREVGPLLLRLFVAFILIYGTQDNILSWAQMLEFRDFLEGHGFPFPLFSAHLSVYAQFTCGILILVGLFTRWAAALMVVNFIIALLMVHVGLPFSANIAPLAMLFGALFFLFYGAGPYSVDARLARQREGRVRTGQVAERGAISSPGRPAPRM